MDEKQLIQEVNYKAVRSSGAGGQNVNKVASKVELHFEILESRVFSDEEKERIISKLQPRLTKDDVLILQCDEARSQHRNKELVTQRFLNILQQALVKPKPRKKTKPSKASKLKRLREKKARAEKKKNRKDPLQ